MVGWALNACHARPEFIPAHRVVNRNGLLTGKHHFGNSSTMEQLLKNEGILVVDDRIINFRENSGIRSQNLSSILLSSGILVKLQLVYN